MRKKGAKGEKIQIVYIKSKIINYKHEWHIYKQRNGKKNYVFEPWWQQ